MCVCVCGGGKSKGRHYGLDSSVNDGAVYQDKKRKGKFWENTFISTVWEGMDTPNESPWNATKRDRKYGT